MERIKVRVSTKEELRGRFLKSQERVFLERANFFFPNMMLDFGYI